MKYFVTLWREHRPFLGISAVFLCLGTVYLWMIPPFEGPDEAQHFAYIQWLIEMNQFPPQGEAAWETHIEQEAGQPPFYYLLASLPARLVGITNPPAVYRPNPYFVAPLPRDVLDNDNRAIHYPEDATPLQGGWLALYLARVVTLGFGLLLIGSVYGFVRELLPDKPEIAKTTTALVAFTPQVIYISSMASNDIPAAALSTLALWLMVKMVMRQTGQKKFAFAAGIVLGLAGLSKVSALTLVVPAGLLLAWMGWTGRCSWWQVIRMGAVFGLGLGLSAGWWFARTMILYGSPLGLETHDLTPWAITNEEDIPPLGLRWLEVARSYWIALGWGTIRPGEWVYKLLFGAMITAVLGLALLVIRWWQSTNKKLHTALLLLALTSGIIVNILFLEVWMHRVIAPYGRLLFPVVAVIDLLLILGWHTIHPRLPWLFCGGVAILATTAPIQLILPAYTPRLLTAEEITQLPPSIGWLYGETISDPIAELVAINIPQRSVISHTIVPIKLCWRAVGTTDIDYAVALQFIGPSNGLAASRRSYTGMGLYPTSAWQPGDVMCDTLHIQTWHDLSETLLYKIEVVMLNEETDTRLLTFDESGEMIPFNFAGVIRLETLASSKNRQTFAGSETLQLLNSQFAPVWQVGETEAVTLTWGVAHPILEDYQVFVHVREASSGETVAQGDGPPLDDWYPTSWWQVGETVVDERSILLPSGIQPGNYQVVVGFYDAATGERFGAEHNLGIVEIRP